MGSFGPFLARGNVYGIAGLSTFWAANIRWSYLALPLNAKSLSSSLCIVSWVPMGLGVEV